MKLEATEDGRWLASGERIGRMTLAEGNTRAEALRLWCEHCLPPLERREKIHLVKDKQQARG